jgi:transaldolase
MKILLGTAALDEVSWAAGAGLADGVLTAPTQLHDVGDGDVRGLLQELCRIVTGPVLASVESVRTDDMYRDGRDLARLSDQIVVEVPLVEDGVAAMRRLSADGVRVAASLVYSPAQALLAAKAGATAVTCALQQLDAEGHYGLQVVEEIRGVFDAGGVECDVLAASATSASEFTRCVLAGADGVALAPDTLRALLIHPLTDRGVDRFLTSLSRLPKGRFGGA